MTIEGFDKRDFPSLYRAASEAAARGQKVMLRLTRLRLIFAILAALSGVFYSVYSEGGAGRTFFASLSIFFFVAALSVEILLLNERPDRTWQSARALTESIKTLSWKFVACADPFPKTMALAEAESLFRAKLRELFSLHDVRVLPDEGRQVTDWMKSVRSASLAHRTEIYMHHRVKAQRNWYVVRSRVARRSSLRFRISLIGLEVMGSIGALLALIGFGFPDFGGVLASAIAGAVAWTGIRQFDNLAEAYALTASELSLISDSGSAMQTEQEWSVYVNSAEQGISREHTMWLARRPH
ncbi:DUF4231 domain-containing protein [Streptomyces longwoodensis]|uniref:DUF4231 domain-containing protein n=1 Tax=Streptomyces longwoodensis TaxID=68231 RepID=UPI0036F97C01